MRLPTFRFTIGHLIAVIAGCAVVFAVIRFVQWSLLLATVLVLPGFAYDRARGRSGLLGAMLAGIFLFVGLFLALMAYSYLKGEANPVDRTSPGALVTLVGLIGLIWGTFVGVLTLLVLLTLGPLLSSRSRSIAPPGPVLRLERQECGLEDPVAGGSRP